MNNMIIIALCLLASSCIIILHREGLLQTAGAMAVTVIAVSLAFMLRIRYLSYATGDYNDFLRHWVQYFRQNGGFRGLSGSVGNYNLPYLYFLALFSYIDVYDLHLIKLLSIAFDVVLAFASMKLVGVVTKSESKRLFCFLGVLMLPTVIINGALWGQCDSIYTAFAVLALWLALDDRPAASMVCMTLSFSFKLQAVFIMPVYFILLFTKRVSFKHFFLFPATYFVIVLPAVVMGRPLIDAVMLYYNQIGSTGTGLNYNSPSIYAFISGQFTPGLLSGIGIFLAFGFVLVIFAWLYRRRENVSNFVVILAAALFCVAVPFFLPHMHDRYFFMADVFTLIVAVLAPKYFVMPLLGSFASLICYYAYLQRRFLMPLRTGSLALIAVGYLLIAEIYFQFDDMETARTDAEMC